MLIDYTAHALARMTERGVSRDEVVQVIAKPLRTVEAAQGRVEFQGMLERATRPMLLRVIAERGDDALTVITVIATSKLGKYGGA